MGGWCAILCFFLVSGALFVGGMGGVRYECPENDGESENLMTVPCDMCALRLRCVARYERWGQKEELAADDIKEARFYECICIMIQPNNNNNNNNLPRFRFSTQK